MTRKKSVINGDVDESLFASKNSSRIQSRQSHQNPNDNNTLKGLGNGPKQYYKANSNVPTSSIISLGTSRMNSHVSVIPSNIIENISKLTGIHDKSKLHSTTSILQANDVYEIKENLAYSSNNSKGRTEGSYNGSNHMNHKEQLGAEHKQRILKLESQRLLQQVLSENDLLKQQADQILLEAARKQLDENDDDVKAMNTMINYAKVVTIRDEQMKEKQRLKEKELLYEKQLDSELEKERLKYLESLAERETARQREQRIGAEIIKKQIAEREQQRLVDEQLRQQEAQQMIEHVKQLELHDEMLKKQRIERGKVVLHDITEHNQKMQQEKFLRKKEDIEEEQRVLQYQHEKEQRERAYEEEQQRLRDEKEKEIQRLRAMQEKAMDRQAAIDELRAKRYQEQKDREYRSQLENERLKKLTTRHELNTARQQQELEKQQVLLRDAEYERDLFLRNMQVMNRVSQQEQERYNQLKQKAERHRLELQRQIREREIQRATERQQYIEEGNRLARQMESEQEKLNTLKQQRLSELAECGVNQLYLTELKKHKVLAKSIHR